MTTLSDHVVGVGDAQVVVKALVGGKKHPVLPNAQVPFPNRSSGVAQRLQHLGNGGLIQRKTTYRGGVEDSWVDP